jgi:hypothetical protein
VRLVKWTVDLTSRTGIIALVQHRHPFLLPWFPGLDLEVNRFLPVSHCHSRQRLWWG